MSKKNLEEVLKELGLDEKEAKIYLSLLSLGRSSIQKTARESEIKRTTAYSVVESLIDKGLVRIELQDKKKLFAAEEPAKLETLLEEKRALISSSLPEFEALFRLTESEGLVKYYRGLNGCKQIYNDLIAGIKPGEDYLIVSDQAKWLEMDPKFFLDFTQRRAKLDIKIKLLLQNNPTGRKFQILQDKYNEKVKLLPAKTELTTNLVVTPQKALIHQMTPPIFGIVIENKSIIQMFQQMFWIIWNSIKD